MSLLSCSSPEIIAETTIETKGSWAKEKQLEANFSLAPSKTYTLFFEVENTPNYPFQNLYLFTKLTTPSGQEIDTLEYQLASPTGEWLGSGWGKRKKNLLIYKENFTPTLGGKYELALQHGMRKDSLQGITEIHFMIEEVNP